MKRRRWCFIPKVYFHNWNKTKNLGTDAFTKWVSIDRYWGGLIIYITVKRYSIQFDFRRDWIADMVDR